MRWCTFSCLVKEESSCVGIVYYWISLFFCLWCLCVWNLIRYPVVVLLVISLPLISCLEWSLLDKCQASFNGDEDGDERVCCLRGRNLWVREDKNNTRSYYKFIIQSLEFAVADDNHDLLLLRIMIKSTPTRVWEFLSSCHEVLVHSVDSSFSVHDFSLSLFLFVVVFDFLFTSITVRAWEPAFYYTLHECLLGSRYYM